MCHQREQAKFVWAGSSAGLRWVCNAWACLSTWGSIACELIILLMHSSSVEFQSFPFSSAMWLQCKKNDYLKTVLHMKWVIYLQLNPAHFAPCGFPAVSIPICCRYFCIDMNMAIHHQAFISIWPQAHSKQREKMKLRRRRQWWSCPLLHLAVNNSPVTSHCVRHHTEKRSAIFYLLMLIMLWFKQAHFAIWNLIWRPIREALQLS